MKANRFRRAISERGFAVGHMVVEFKVRSVAQLAEAAGADFAILDMEHGMLGIADVADLIGWFRATSVAPFVRIPSIEYPAIARPLDAGALGIMVPRVRTVEEVKRVVRFAKYPPEGERGLGLGLGHNDYVRVSAADYLPEANASTVVVCQIETRESLESLDGILATPGVDVVFVGPNDLSQALGVPGRYDHPRFREAIGAVAEAARRHGKVAAVQPASIDDARPYVELGFQAISYANDIAVYRQALDAGVGGLRALFESRGG